MKRESKKGLTREASHVMCVRIPHEVYERLFEESHRRSLASGEQVTMGDVLREYIAKGLGKKR